MFSLKQLLCAVAVLTLELVFLFPVEAYFDSCVKVLLCQLLFPLCLPPLFLVLFHGKRVKSFFVLRCFLQGHCLNLSEEGIHTRHVTKNDVCEAEAAVSVS